MTTETGRTARPAFLLMVGAPPVGCPPRTTLRSALRSGLAAQAAGAHHAWEHSGRCGALEEE